MDNNSDRVTAMFYDMSLEKLRLPVLDDGVIK